MCPGGLPAHPFLHQIEPASFNLRSEHPARPNLQRATEGTTGHTIHLGAGPPSARGAAAGGSSSQQMLAAPPGGRRGLPSHVCPPCPCTRLASGGLCVLWLRPPPASQRWGPLGLACDLGYMHILQRLATLPAHLGCCAWIGLLSRWGCSRPGGRGSRHPVHRGTTTSSSPRPLAARGCFGTWWASVESLACCDVSAAPCPARSNRSRPGKATPTSSLSRPLAARGRLGTCSVGG